MLPNRTRLRSFIDKATEVFESRYAKELQDPISVSINWNATEGIASTSRTGPNEEAIKAALLSIRFFCQDNEKLSLRKMADFVAQLPVSQQLKDDFATIRNRLNAYLDRPHGPPQFQIGGHTVTSREIFEAFMYGKYAHLTQSETIEGWERLVSYDGMRASFDRVLRQFIQSVVLLMGVCKDMDAELEAQEAA